jgi:dual specificity protein kinase YAK1
MDSQWQPYGDPPIGRTTQFGSNAGSHPPPPNAKYGGQQPPQAQPPAGYTYETYQTPTASKASTIPPNSKPASMASSPAATPHSRDFIADNDTPMEDADPYNRSKYPTRSSHHNRPSSQYMTNEESSATRRYSPMNILSPTLPYTASPSKSQNSFGFPPVVNSSRQSPTRANTFPSPSQSYQTPCKFRSLSALWATIDNVGVVATARISRLPPIQSAERSPEQYYPPSAISQPNSAFGSDDKSPRPGLPHNQSQAPSRGPMPKFQKIKSVQELHPRIHSQPPYRRANPEGGFISVSRSSPHSPKQSPN